MIEPEVAELLESPSSLLVATVDSDRVPEGARAWGVEVLGPERIRLLLASNADRTLANLEGGGRLALTTTHFVTLVSWQLKGTVVEVGPATAADRIRYDAFCAGCVEIVSEIDQVPRELVWRMVPPGIVACEMDVEQVFDQTPGPQAGSRVAPVAG